jgi:hypothetical protein
MVEFFDLLLLALALSLAPVFARRSLDLNVRGLNTTALLLGPAVFLGCVTVAFIFHEPVPRIHDEFSYVLMGDALSHGRVAYPSPPLPEFFETFHVFVRPVYASKYFPVQGIFLAIGEKFTGHPVVGVWLSAALACVASLWMLKAWVGFPWALLGSGLMALQYGILSDWSQSYWGGMAAALGGALFFSAVRRLYDKFGWKSASILGLGLVVLVNTRPLEGFIATLPASGMLLHCIWNQRRWTFAGFWWEFMAPAAIVLSLGIAATGAYNHAITGSALKPPYMLHEEQYQESPPLIFMPMRPSLNYSSQWIAYNFHVRENALWERQRIPAVWIGVVGTKLATSWAFYCGVLLTAPLILPGILNRGIRYWQILVLSALIFLGLTTDQGDTAARLALDIVAAVQVGLLWLVFEDTWDRLAILSAVLVLLEMQFVKVAFPHYFAPAACLILYLQVKGLKLLWEWQPVLPAKNRSERRRLARRAKEDTQTHLSRWRGFVLLLPFACLLSLLVRIEAKIQGWKEDAHGPDRQVFLRNDRSLRRAELERWLSQQSRPQLVFVRYSQRHNVNFEWVYNHADLIHSNVIWARDLGAEHNRLLLDLLRGRNVWLLEADRPDPVLVPYTESTLPTALAPLTSEGDPSESQLNW